MLNFYCHKQKKHLIFIEFLLSKQQKYTVRIQGVHKVLLQFKKFITKAVDEISYIDLFFINQCLLKFLFKLKFFVSD